MYATLKNNGQKKRINHSRFKKATLFLVSLTSILGCATDLTDDSVIPPGGTGKTGTHPAPEVVFNNLVIEPFIDQTYGDNMPIYGRGPSNGSISFTANGIEVVDSIPAGGVFCVDIPLELGLENTVLFQAYNSSGEAVLEEPIQESIFQTGAAPDSQQQQNPVARTKNVGPTAHNMYSSMNFDVPGFDLSFSGDGDWPDMFEDPTNTTLVEKTARIKNFFNFDIDADGPLQNIAVTTANNYWLQHVDVYYSDIDSEENLFIYELDGEAKLGNGWQLWGSIPDNNKDYSIDLSAPGSAYGTEAKRIGFHFVDLSIWGWGAHHINHIEILASEESSNDSSQSRGDTCAGGRR